jgi:hypothetical protein
VRAQVAVFGLIVMGAMAAQVQAAEPAPADATLVKIARVMALAEADLQFRRAELGLIGASLPGLSEACRVPDTSSSDAKPEKEATAPPAPAADETAPPVFVGHRH